MEITKSDSDARRKGLSHPLCENGISTECVTQGRGGLHHNDVIWNRLLQRYHCSLIFVRGSVRMSVGKLAILIEVIRGFLQLLHANAGIVVRLGYDHFLSNPF
jgi:hypothetical protein